MSRHTRLPVISRLTPLIRVSRYLVSITEAWHKKGEEDKPPGHLRKFPYHVAQVRTSEGIALQPIITLRAIPASLVPALALSDTICLRRISRLALPIVSGSGSETGRFWRARTRSKP